MTLEDRAEDRARHEVLLERLDRLERQVCTIDQAQAASAEDHRKTRGLLEDLQGRFRVLAEAQAANAQSIADTRAELVGQINAVDRRVMELDVKLNGRIDALDTTLSRIATHLGLNGASHPQDPRPRGTAKRRKAR